MGSQTIEQCARAKQLGTFQQRYSEAMPLFVVLLFICLLVFWAIGLIWPTFTSTQSYPVWLLLLLEPIILFLLIGLWRGYLISRENWLYLYDDGFVYVRQGQIQGYHVQDMLAVEEIVFVNTSHGGDIPCVVKLTNGEQRRIQYGAQVKFRLEQYQRQQRAQRSKQEQRGLGETL